MDQRTRTARICAAHFRADPIIADVHGTIYQVLSGHAGAVHLKDCKVNPWTPPGVTLQSVRKLLAEHPFDY